MPKWTEEQQLAIDKEGTNIIVSAGAGSGKTAVLTARVIRKLKSGVNINQLLILTFTNKAAFEMKDRIRQAITEDKSLVAQLDFIDGSYISTFDSFALSMVKKYSYLLGVGKNVNIADSSTIYLEKKKIIEDIFDRLYQENNKNFLNLLNDFTIKKDDEIKEYILDINDKLDLKYDKIDYLNNYLEKYYSDSNISMLIDKYNYLLKSKIKEIDGLLTALSNYVDSDYYSILIDEFRPLLESETYDEIKNNCLIKMSQLPRGSEEDAKKTKELIGKLLDGLEELTRFDDVNELKDTLLSTKEYASIIIDIIKELDFRLNDFKNNLNIYEFVDISKMAIRILKENKNVCEELRNSFNEIMIDEYQDTSDLQDIFISLIQNNNVYMVGDIKQSIYRFRNANPYLFKEKYDNYSKSIDGFKIDLTKNFRSRSEVIDNINLLFSILMTDNMGGADYSLSHKMLFGNMTYENEGKTTTSNNFEIYNYEYDKELGYSKEEIEIFFIVKDIKKKVEEKYQVFDRKINKLRDITYGDFSILLDKSTNFDLYKKIFQYFNIPISKYNSTNITDEIEIVLIKNILKLLINRRDNNYDVEFKYAFTSVARSFLFEYSDQDIFDMVTNSNYKSTLIDVIDSIVEHIDSISLNELINEIIDKFDFYSKFILIGDVKNRINRVSSIIDIFDSLANIGYVIDDVYNYLDDLINDQYKLEVKELDVIPNSVKIMTIHASKGLEFPICYFASYNSKFNITDLNEKFMFNNEYGIITPYFKEGIGKTFVKDLVKNSYIKEEVSEKIRLLYVALTRAKEKFIIVTSMDKDKIYDISLSRSFLDMICYCKDVLSPYIVNFDVSNLGLTRDYNLIKKYNYKDAIPKAKDTIKINEIEIHNDLVKKEKISKENKNLIDKETYEVLKLGTKVHEALELLDFKNPDYDILDLDNSFIGKIKEFLKNIDLENVRNIYKEYEFCYEDDGKLYHGIIDLILEYDNVIEIIDYKLKDINDDHYYEQLNNYKKYISKMTNKKVELYLYSIINSSMRKIES